jgi:hypothetical protein
MSTELQKSNDEKISEVDSAVLKLQNSKSIGFAYSLEKAKVVEKIQDMLTTDVMKPIMSMCGKPYGFRTDRDSKPDKYKEDVVKDCLIQATLLGAEPTGNQFNIIGGNCYITKEGCFAKLKKMGVYFELSFSISKKIHQDGRDIWVKPVHITFDNKGDIQKKCMEFVYNKYDSTSESAAEGMAKRDAAAWIIEQVTGIRPPVGDCEEKPIDITSSMFNERPETEIKAESKNENVESAEVIEDVKEPSKKEMGAMTHLQNSTTLEILEKRLGEVNKAGHSESKFVQDKYLEMKKTLTV